MSILRCLLVLFVAQWLAAQPAHAAEPAPVAVPGNLDVLEVIERARQALLADKYGDAAAAVEATLEIPEFTELDSAVQFQVFLIGAFADSGREEYLGAHEFMVLATEMPQAKAEHWFMRAQYASWVDAWPDALIAATTIARRWPESLATSDSMLISRIAYRANEDGRRKAEVLELLNALFAATFTLDWDSEPDGLWKDLLADALERNDLRRAREIAKRLQNPSTLLLMRADRRFDALVKAEPRIFNLRLAVERECKRLAKASAANPRSLSVRVQYGYALLAAGQFSELLNLADGIIARTHSAPQGAPPFDDVVDQLNWIYNHKADSLRALGRWDEALAVMEAARRESEQGNDNVSQAINLGWHYADYGKPQEALDALAGIDWARSLSPYGRMQLQHVRYRAYLQLANTQEADNVFAYLREHHGDAEETWQLAMVDAGDFDGAAALLISRLRDPQDRSQALAEVQRYQSTPLLPKQAEERARWEKLVARADVVAAIDEVGRREDAPLYNVTD